MLLLLRYNIYINLLFFIYKGSKSGITASILAKKARQKLKSAFSTSVSYWWFVGYNIPAGKSRVGETLR